MRLLLQKKHRINIDAVDNEGNTAILYACKNKLIEIAKVLIDNDANVNQRNNKNEIAMTYFDQLGIMDHYVKFCNWVRRKHFILSNATGKHTH